jgi:hypothetical protein
MEVPMNTSFRIIAALAAALISTGAFADDTAVSSEKKYNVPETLFGSSDLHLSGYGAPVYQITKIGEKAGHLAGGRGGLIINDSFVVGGGGFGLAYPDRRSDISGKSYNGEYTDLNFGYGGVLYEYHFSPKSLFHVSVGTLIGGGKLSFSKKDSDDGDTRKTVNKKSFFVAEPEVGGYMNITRWCRLGVLCSYRFTKGANMLEFKDKDFRSLGASIAAEFGWF